MILRASAKKEVTVGDDSTAKKIIIMKTFPECE